MRLRTHPAAARTKEPDPAVVPIPTLLAAAAALLVLVAAVLATRGRLQSDLRSLLAEREGRAAAALFEGRLAALRAEGQDDPLLAAVEAAALPQLLKPRAVTLHDATGRIATRLLGAAEVPAFPAGVRGTDPSAAGVSVRYLPAEGGLPPRLRVHFPLRDDSGAGIAGRVAMELEAEGLAEEYGRLGVAMRRQGLWTLCVSGSALGAAFLAAFAGMARSNRLLAERTRLLEATHRELALADRAGAVGAVAAHLVHGLRGPLSGLQAFLSGLRPGDVDPDAVREAADSARRMRALVDEVVRVLRDRPGCDGFEVPVDELLPLLDRRLPAEAAARGVRLRMEPGPKAALGSRRAGIVLLVLDNLLSNAAKASPDRAEVRLSVSGSDAEGLAFRVADSGPGLPSRILETLFQPAFPGGPGGSGGLGLGLAISRRLAAAVGADLALESTGSGGTTFRLVLPPEERA